MADSFLNELSIQTSVLNISSTENDKLENIQRRLHVRLENYLKLKLIYSIIEECLKRSTSLNTNLKVKIKDNLLFGNCIQWAPFPLKPPEKLTYSEQIPLYQEIKQRLIQKLSEAKISCEDYYRADRKLFQMNTSDIVMLETKQRLIKEQCEYLDNVEKLEQLLSQIVNRRLEIIPKVIENKVREAELTTEINYLKSQLTELKLRTDIFTETNNTLEAYKKLIKDIKNQQDEYSVDIQGLQDLKEKYKQISCAEYNDILRTYLQYKNSIKKRKMIFECTK